jgi:hypothetical protein
MVSFLVLKHTISSWSGFVLESLSFSIAFSSLYFNSMPIAYYKSSEEEEFSFCEKLYTPIAQHPLSSNLFLSLSRKEFRFL